jgi:hypothetical protein
MLVPTPALLLQCNMAYMQRSKTLVKRARKICAAFLQANADAILNFS